MGVAYKYLEPGPYCPLTGKAQTTCNAWLEALAAAAADVALRLSSVAPKAIEGSAGMVEREDTEAATRWPGQVIYSMVARHPSCVFAAEDGSTDDRGRRREKQRAAVTPEAINRQPHMGGGEA